MSVDFEKKLYKNLFTIGSYNYGYTLFQFFASMVLSRLLTPGEYGIVALVTVFTGFISFFKDAGLSYLVIREDYRDRFNRAIQMVSFSIGLCLSILILLLAYPISWFYENSILVLPTFVMAFVLILEAMSVVPIALLKKRLLFKDLGRINFLVYVSGSIITIVLAVLNFSYWALVFGQLYSAFLLLILIQRKAELSFNYFSRKNLAVGFKKAKEILYNVSGSRLINYWSDNTDNLVIGKIYGAAKLGVYSRAFQLLIMQLNLISGVFNSVLFPSLKQVFNTKNDFINEYKTALGGMSLIIMPIMIILVYFSKPVIRIIWGLDWIGVANLTPYFGILSMTYILSRTFGSIYILYRKENLLFKIGVISALITVVMVFLGIQFSIESVAFFISLGYVLLILPITLYVAFIKGFGFPVLHILEFWFIRILSSGVALIGLYFELELLIHIGVISLILQVLIQEFGQIKRLLNFMITKVN